MAAEVAWSVVIGIVTVRPGSSLSVTRTATVSPSVTLYKDEPKDTVTAGGGGGGGGGGVVVAVAAVAVLSMFPGAD